MSLGVAGGLWLFPGKTVRIDTSCLDCGNGMVLEVRDGKVLSAQPEGIIGTANYGFALPSEQFAFM